ncbi:MAG: serine hydrolase domain-containing protein [Bacteroidota bacterium]|nr:serine hydrolase domain-containing protein [Bacteroidota bacterium]
MKISCLALAGLSLFLGLSNYCWGQLTAATLPKGTNIEAAKKHVTRPQNITGISMEDNDKPEYISMAESKLKFQKAKTYQLDVAIFTQAIHNSLKDSVNGYVMQLTRNGSVISNLKWNWAQTPSDASIGWDFDTRMHVASVSKYLTALGMMKALNLAQLSYDTKIIDYLPANWVKGSNINQITFRQLLTHRSGFDLPCCASDFEYMKQKVQAGVTNVGSFDYHNMNFGLCRILIPIVMKYLNKDMSMTDSEWDISSILWYQYFMQERVFTPSGVASVSCDTDPAKKSALAYKFPKQNEDGWNSGNLYAMSGGAGWRLSVSELLKIMSHARRTNDILRKNDSQHGLDNKFGIDQVIETPVGKLYNKNGRWTNNGRIEQSVIYFLPGDMELAILVNSEIGNGEGKSLRGRVKEAYLSSLRLK